MIKITNSNIEIFFHPNDLRYAEEFFKVYDLINFDFAAISSGIELKEPTKRNCRYCKKSYPLVTFNKIAHTIPEFLGNTASISDFECDVCNKHFGKLENQLSKFLGAAPALNRTKGKKKIPNFQSANGKIEAKEIDFYGAKTAIEFGSTQNSSELITYDEGTNRYVIRYDTQPFVPYDVYKAFLKIALGLIHEDTVNNFRKSFELLQDIRNKLLAPSDKVFAIKYNVSHVFNYTGAILCVAKNEFKSHPKISLVFLYGQAMFQLFFESDDQLEPSEDETVNIPILPPPLITEDINRFRWNTERIDLNGTASQSRNEGISIIPGDLDTPRVALNLKTGERIENAIFDPSQVVKFIIIDDPKFGIPFS